VGRTRFRNSFGKGFLNKENPSKFSCKPVIGPQPPLKPYSGEAPGFPQNLPGKFALGNPWNITETSLPQLT